MLPMLIGIAGGTGSGKTTVAEKLAEAMPAERVALISHDWYYRDRSHLDAAARARINFDEPDALENDLLLGHLLALKANRAVACPQYDFASHTRGSKQRQVAPCSIILVEGILLFAVEALREVFDLRLFVDTDDDVRLLRRVRRDIEERGRDIDSIATQYLGTVRRMHQQHVAPSRAHAHLIIPEGGENAPALEVIVSRLLYLLDRERTAQV
ncbi:MAG TPA: uridine kinase [Polyangia bacterium]|jgi:uridine kinase